MVDFNNDNFNKYMDFGQKALSAFSKSGKNFGWFGGSGGGGLGSSGGWGNFGGFGGFGSSGGGSGAGGGAPWGAIANAAKSGYSAFFNKDDGNYSDLEESIVYPLQGAGTGASYGGGWGALGGALYGLGYSFKDDIGLKDNNFLTDIIFPIGMGDEHKGFIQL